MVPSVGSGFLAAFACVDQKMAPNRAQLPQQFLGSSQERARDGVPPLLHPADEFLEADFRLVQVPALGVGMGMP